MSSDTSIFVGAVDNTAWIRIEGVATKDTSGGIREYVNDSFEDGLRVFIIDLEACQLIDSTFIGILTALAGNIADESCGGEVRVIHSNERNRKSICKLGLDNIIHLGRNGFDIESWKERVGSSLAHLETDTEMSRTDKATMILDAHEHICEANEDNYDEFRDVLAFLRQDLESSANN